MPIKSFRGLMANDTQERISLHHNNGKTGYKVIKFDVISNNPTGDDTESVVSIWKTAETPSTTIDFGNNRLLASAFFSNAKAVPNTVTSVIVFDNEIFNQDIYVNVKGGGGGADSMNYYIELEEIPLALDEATVATLKDIRNSGDPT